MNELAFLFAKIIITSMCFGAAVVMAYESTRDKVWDGLVFAALELALGCLCIAMW